MSFTLTVSAEDWTSAGAYPATGYLEIQFLHPILGEPVITDRGFTGRLDVDGAGAWELPTIPSDNALKVRSRVSGLYAGRTFYFGDPGPGPVSLSALIQSHQVDQATLTPTEEALAGWQSALQSTAANVVAAGAARDEAEAARVAALGVLSTAAQAASDAGQAAVSATTDRVAAQQARVDASAYAQAAAEIRDTVIGVIGRGPTSARPAPSNGIVWVDTTLGHPVWSDGTIWRTFTDNSAA